MVPHRKQVVELSTFSVGHHEDRESMELEAIVALGTSWGHESRLPLTCAGREHAMLL